MLPPHNGCVYDLLIGHRSEARPTLFPPLLLTPLELAGARRSAYYFPNRPSLPAALQPTDLRVIHQLVLHRVNVSPTFYFPTPDRTIQTCAQDVWVRRSPPRLEKRHVMPMTVNFVPLFNLVV